jgi:ubiquinone/menaquinone biosynthesis C-methylase UbiE
MKKKNKGFDLFNLIAPAYGLFYDYQKKNYMEAIDKLQREVDLSSYSEIVDIGCGTGVLSAILTQNGFSVTGVDPSKRMLKIGSKKHENAGVEFVLASVLEGLPFKDNNFDVSFASYVAHGLNKHERKIMYAEMSRITKHLIIIFDYNENRSMLTNIVEWLEGGDYFNFIKKTKTEMRKSFKDVHVINVGARGAWYICKV